ncbi:MAG: DUF1929 domain-containing protein [Phycisphaerae bacterium]|nr:DUF1929 domain-containing protein [Phycisphaerae bacterium]
MPGSWESQLPFGRFANGFQSTCVIHAAAWYNPEFGNTARIVAIDGGQNFPFSTPSARCFDPLMPPIGTEDPYTNAYRDIPNDRTNLFCSGHCPLGDGSLFFASGQFWELGNPNSIQPATRNCEIFGFVQPQWRRANLPTLHVGRWYPTLVRDGVGDVLIFSGEKQYNPRHVEASAEIYRAAQNIIEKLSSGADILLVNPYGFFFLLPAGQVFFAGGDQNTKFLNTVRNAWTNTQPNSVHPERNHCTSCMYEPGMVLKIGGYADPQGQAINAVRTVSRIDVTSPSASSSWIKLGDLIRRRCNATSVTLPEGSIAVVAGNEGVDSTGKNINPVLTAEFFDPFVAPAQFTTHETPLFAGDPRGYHSVALLVSDGRIFVGGGDSFTTPNQRYRTFQMLRPPYFDGSPNRPVINSVSDTLWSPQSSLSVSIGFGWESSPPPANPTWEVALLAPGSVTHGFDMNQRRIALKIESVTGDTITVERPGNANEVPPGWYMLWLINKTSPPTGSRGVPSKLAAWVRVAW